jgi:hypothetical protein
MDAIARAANANWRRIYVMKLDALPQVIAPRTVDAAASTKQETKPPRKSEPKTRLFANHPTATGKPTKFQKRDFRKGGQRKYLPGIRPPQPTLEEMQKQAMMGLYGTFFLLDSESSRETAMKNFQSGLENQLKRLEALPANQRVITTMMTRRNFQRLIDDFANLDKEQKKQAQALYDYAKEQLEKPPLK